MSLHLILIRKLGFLNKNNMFSKILCNFYVIYSYTRIYLILFGDKFMISRLPRYKNCTRHAHCT